MSETLIDRIVRLKPFVGSEVFVSLSMGDGIIFNHRAWGFVALEWASDTVPGRFRDASPRRWIYASQPDISEVAKVLELGSLFETMREWKIHKARREAIEAEGKLIEAKLLVARYQRRIARLDERNERYYRGHSRKDYVESLSKALLEEAEAHENFQDCRDWANDVCFRELEKLAKILGFKNVGEP